MSLNKVRPCSINLNIRKWGEKMKKLGKKVHNSMETIEAYACGCGCSCTCSKSCDYSTDCGSMTTVMVSLMQGSYNYNYSNNSNPITNSIFANALAM